MSAIPTLINTHWTSKVGRSPLSLLLKMAPYGGEKTANCALRATEDGPLTGPRRTQDPGREKRIAKYRLRRTGFLVSSISSGNSASSPNNQRSGEGSILHSPLSTLYSPISNSLSLSHLLKMAPYGGEKKTANCALRATEDRPLTGPRRTQGSGREKVNAKYRLLRTGYLISSF
jgi:hypothetical protein